MIEMILIFAIAAGVLYYLYGTLKEYLSNENNQKRFTQGGIINEKQAPLTIEPTFEEKIRVSEFGTLSGILGYVANADGEICALEKDVAQSMFEEMAQGMSKLGSREEIQKELETIFFSPTEDITGLTKRFCDLTKGEYRKKLKVVEFCFVLGYADGGLNEATKEAIIDVGALLELDNADFNGLYDDFAQENLTEVSLEEARELFGDVSKEELHKKYTQLISEAKQSFTDDERLNKTKGKDQLLQLRKIHQSYEILKNNS